MEEIVIKTKDLDIYALYSEAKNPKGLVQIVHGMIEHKERYIDFINYLNENGYTVIVSDNRGHGKSINEENFLGHVGAPDVMVNDQYEVTKYIKGKNPNLPLYMFAHSMGSVIARAYIEKHDDEIKKLILSGTVAYNPGAMLGITVAKMKRNKKGYSKLLWAFSNDASFKEDLSWLSYNQENIKNYSADPLCSFKFTNFSNLTLFTMVNNLKKKNRYAYKNKNLEILSLSGKDDRTTLGTKKLKKTLGFLKAVGYNVNFKEYPMMKHEILNEDEHMLVYKDALDFFNK